MGKIGGYVTISTNLTLRLLENKWQNCRNKIRKKVEEIKGRKKTHNDSKCEQTEQKMINMMKNENKNT